MSDCGQFSLFLTPFLPFSLSTITCATPQPDFTNRPNIHTIEDKTTFSPDLCAIFPAEYDDNDILLPLLIESGCDASALPSKLNGVHYTPCQFQPQHTLLAFPLPPSL